MKTRILMDTGPLVAFLNRKDRYHAWVSASLDDFMEVKHQTFVTKICLSGISFCQFVNI